VGHNNKTPELLARLVRIWTCIRDMLDGTSAVLIGSLIVSLSLNRFRN
jgi:hypothetical protein